MKSTKGKIKNFIIIPMTIIFGFFLFVFLIGHYSSPSIQSVEAQNKYLEMFLICGDHYYYLPDVSGGMVGEKGFTEIVGLRVHVNPEPLNSADKANKIEWKGKIILTADRNRFGSPLANYMGDWRAGAPFIDAMSKMSGSKKAVDSLVKKNGKWIAGNSATRKFMKRHTKYTCENIKNIFPD